MTVSGYTGYTTGIAVYDPTNLDGTPLFQADATGIYSNGNPVNAGSTTAAVTAHAGGGQSSATALTADYNFVTVCATNFDSVKLESASVGLEQVIKNSGAAILSVFPATGDAINGLAVNLSIDIPIGGEVAFHAIDSTTWETMTTLSLTAPSTQKGNLVIKAANNAGNTQTIITNASQAAARTYTIPDGGTSTNFVMGAGTQTIAGATTFTLAVPISAVTNQLVLGTTNTTTINATAPSASRVYTVPDAGGAASFALTAGAQTFSGVQTYGAINAEKSTNNITALAGGGQSGATAIVSRLNSITVCATAGDSVLLPAATVGEVIQIGNLGATAAAVFPASGELIDALSTNASVSLAVGGNITFSCVVAGSWKSTAQVPLGAKFSTNTTTTTFTAGQLTGAAWVSYASTAATPGSIATRSASQMFADDPYARVGGGYRLRISNTASGSATMTITAGSSVTLTGTATVADATYRDFVVTYTSATALVIQNIGSGTL